MSTLATAASAQMLFMGEKFLNSEESDVPAFNDPQPGATDAPFYDRTRAFFHDVADQVAAGEQPDLYYRCTGACDFDYSPDEALISFPVQMSCDDTGFLASELEFNVQFYQDGIARFLIGEKDNTRFRISQEGLPVEWSQLNPVLRSNLTTE